MGISYFIREHQFHRSEDGGEYCDHCNSRTGIGFYCIVTCGLRFNQKGFEQYLEFMNISKANNVYNKRFSSQVFTKRELMERFKKTCDMELTKEIVKQKIYVTENAL